MFGDMLVKCRKSVHSPKIRALGVGMDESNESLQCACCILCVVSFHMQVILDMVKEFEVVYFCPNEKPLADFYVRKVKQPESSRVNQCWTLL